MRNIIKILFGLSVACCLFLFAAPKIDKPANAQTWSLSAGTPSGGQVTFTCGGCPNPSVEIFVLDTNGTTVIGNSGAMASPRTTWTWNYGSRTTTHTANLVAFGSSIVATTTVTLPAPPAGFPFILGPASVNGTTATFSIAATAGGGAGAGSILFLKDLSTSIPIPSGATSIAWTGAAGPHQAVISAFGVDVSNTVSFTLGSGSGTVGGAGCEGFLDCMTSITSPTTAFSESGLIGAIFSSILPIIIGLGGFLTVILIVISGIQFVTSSGNPEAAAAARGRLTFAIIGFALLVLAFAITQIVDNVFLRGSGIF